MRQINISISLIIVFHFFFTFSVNAQMDCGCDHYINQSGIYRPASEGTGRFYLDVKPGQTICVAAGNYTELRFINFQGTSLAPIEVKNCGGVVNISNNLTTGGIIFEKSRYFILTGTGESNIPYGFKISQTGDGASGVIVANKSSDCEIEGVEVTGARFAGMMLKTDPDCDSTSWRSHFTMYNVNIHHNYIHDVDGEGIYAGNSFYTTGVTRTCPGVAKQVFPHQIMGLSIHDNLIRYTGAEGIQFGCSPDAEVFDNTVEYAGSDPFAAYQDNGIQCGEGSGGNIFNNIVKNTKGSAIVAVGHAGNVLIANNLLLNSGASAIYANNDASTVVGSYFRVINNTIVKTGTYPISLANEVNDNVVANNAIISTGYSQYIFFNENAFANIKNNYMTPSVVASLGFVDTMNYKITSASPLFNAGFDVSAWGVTKDADGGTRPMGSAYDIGYLEAVTCTGTNDKIAPLVKNCPRPIRAYTAGNSIPISWVPPVVTDECSSVTTYVNYAPGSLFSIGNKTVKYLFKDSKNNTSKCEFTVKVTKAALCRNDTIPPVLTGCRTKDTIIYTFSSSLPVSWTEPNATDNCLTPTLTCNYINGQSFTQGLYTVRYTAMDPALNKATCAFNLRIVSMADCVYDTVKPQLHNCPKDTTVNTLNYTTVIGWNEPTPYDNCGATIIYQNYKPNSTFSLGVKTVVYIAADRRGNRDTCRFKLIIKYVTPVCDTDRIAPVWSNCPSNITASTGTKFALVTWTPPTATDNCVAPTTSTNYLPNTYFAVGTTRQIVYKAWDRKNNISTCSFQVTVNRLQVNKQSASGTTTTNTSALTAAYTNPETVVINKEEEQNSTASQFADIELGTLPLKTLSEIVCFPNPTKTDINISFNSLSDMSIELVLLNVEGKILRQTEHELVKGMNQIKHDVAGLPQGVYMYIMKMPDGNSENLRFIKY